MDWEESHVVFHGSQNVETVDGESTFVYGIW